MAVTNQPGRFGPSEFQTGLFECHKDLKTSCCVCCCFMCVCVSIAKDMNECCYWGSGMEIRAVYRNKYRIQGSLWKDYFATCLCPCCAQCQLRRDIDLRKEQGIF